MFQNARQASQVWVAAGPSAAAFLARARALDSTHVPVRLFYFFDNATKLDYLSELDALAHRKPNFQFHPVAPKGAREAIASIFDAMLPPWDDKHYLLSGPDELLNYLGDYLTRHGVPGDAIFFERVGV